MARPSNDALKAAGLTLPDDPTWRELISEFFTTDAGHTLLARLEAARGSGTTIYPPSERIFEALRLTPFDEVKVVILGQDPYHGPGQAHGLAFSVPPGVPPPPSLRNIFKELASDCHLPIPKAGDLRGWAEHGVLLLNTTLTVAKGAAGAHAGWGWEKLTTMIVARLAKSRDGLAFVLWGDKAQKFATSIDPKRHLIISSPHPSPLSAYRGFFDSKPFSKINAFRKSRGEPAIDWQLA